MVMAESDYARFVLTPPSAEQLRDKADQERKAAKENGPDYCRANIARRGYIPCMRIQPCSLHRRAA